MTEEQFVKSIADTLGRQRQRALAERYERARVRTLRQFGVDAEERDWRVVLAEIARHPSAQPKETADADETQ